MADSDSEVVALEAELARLLESSDEEQQQATEGDEVAESHEMATAEVISVGSDSDRSSDDYTLAEVAASAAGPKMSEDRSLSEFVVASAAGPEVSEARRRRPGNLVAGSAAGQGTGEAKRPDEQYGGAADDDPRYPPADDDPRYPHHTTQLHPQGIELVPVPAGMWNIRCCPGRDWDANGYGPQNGNGWGTIVRPDDPRVLGEWEARLSDPGLQCLGCGVRHCIGGWWLGRSTAVAWDCDPTHIYYYRCGDWDGSVVYDLSCRLDDATNYWNGLTYEVVHRAIGMHLAMWMGNPRAQSIMNCEEARWQDPALSRLLNFENVQNVLRSI